MFAILAGVFGLFFATLNIQSYHINAQDEVMDGLFVLQNLFLGLGIITWFALIIYCGYKIHWVAIMLIWGGGIFYGSVFFWVLKHTGSLCFLRLLPYFLWPLCAYEIVLAL